MKSFLEILLLKPGLYEVVIIAEHVCNNASKMILQLLTHQSQIFLVKDKYLVSLQVCIDQAISGQLKNMFA